jgi:2-polyprenyl-3-methyl-5-hydroxy-6-metoxy-1,4-benzoquinol methylase
MIYREFAHLYATGEYPRFSKQIAKLLPSILKEYQFQPNTILDIACGEGTFAVEMAKQGYSVTGVDQSPEMLTFARNQAEVHNLAITFLEMDIRGLKINVTFDLVTCWFDSLNYLLVLDELETTFTRVFQHLNPGGFFIFDLNTIHWLTTLAERHKAVIERETEDIYQVHQHSFNEETQIATFKLTGFLKENDRWIRRVDEIHHERGYTLDEIRSCVKKAGLKEVACYSNLEERQPIAPDSKRMWFVTRK